LISSVFLCFFFFFFSSRRRHTRSDRDWSSDVCSSDLNIRTVAYDGGLKNAFDFPGFVPAYVRPLFCEGKGPFRWVALSGDPRDRSEERRVGKECRARRGE